MPEGDSLHRLASELAPKLIGKRVRKLQLVRSASRTEGLRGSKIVGVEARGKNLLIHLETAITPAETAPSDVADVADELRHRQPDGAQGVKAVQAGASEPEPPVGSEGERFTVHVHLKMNGRVRIYRLAGAPPVATSAASLVLETEEHRVVVYAAPIARLLRTRDVRRDFHFRGLGPDLLGPSFDLDEASARLRTRGPVPLGEAVMDQGVVAGIGNVWKSELLFTLRLDPFAKVSKFGDTELSALLSLARMQMYDNVYGRQRTNPDPFVSPAQRKTRVDPRQGEGALSVYGRLDQPCYDCGTKIQMQRQGELLRSTYYCPTCQPTRGEP